MVARRHLCCYINEETHEGCDEVAVTALGYYHPDVPGVYGCDEHRWWVPKQWNGYNDPHYYALLDGFDPKFDSPQEIREARHRLVKAGVIPIG